MFRIHSYDKDYVSGGQCSMCLNALLKRLYLLENMALLEQALVTRVYLTGKYPQSQESDGVKDLQKLLNGMASTRISC
jgi:hypothetical protein